VTEYATATGAELAHLVIGILLLVVCYKAGQWVYFRTKRLLFGWAAGAAIFMLAGLVIAPAMAGLNVAKCRGASSPSLCESGTYGPDY
jgi:hypothetical protein